MKIDFNDGSSIECFKNNGKIVLTISAIDINNSRKKIINTVELNSDEFKKLISESL